MADIRRPAEESKAMLIAAAAEIIRAEGYEALSARRLAEKVGLKRQIVHYYFRTIDDLLVAVIKFYGDNGLARISEVIRKDPLRAIWEVEPNASATSFAFIAMAGHKPAVRDALRYYMEQFRKLQTEAIAAYFKARGIKPSIPPTAASIIIQSVAQTLAVESSMGISLGHMESKAAIEGILKSLAKDGRISKS